MFGWNAPVILPLSNIMDIKIDNRIVDIKTLHIKWIINTEMTFQNTPMILLFSNPFFYVIHRRHVVKINILYVAES